MISEREYEYRHLEFLDRQRRKIADPLAELAVGSLIAPLGMKVPRYETAIHIESPTESEERWSKVARPLGSVTFSLGEIIRPDQQIPLDSRTITGRAPEMTRSELPLAA